MTSARDALQRFGVRDPPALRIEIDKAFARALAPDCRPAVAHVAQPRRRRHVDINGNTDLGIEHGSALTFPGTPDVRDMFRDETPRPRRDAKLLKSPRSERRFHATEPRYGASQRAPPRPVFGTLADIELSMPARIYQYDNGHSQTQDEFACPTPASPVQIRRGAQARPHASSKIGVTHGH